MADWNKIPGVGNVEDRRGVRPGVALGGAGGLIVLVAFMFLGGQNPTLDSIFNTLLGGGTTQQSQSLSDTDQAYKTFAGKVLASTNETWQAKLTANGTSFTEPKLVLFRQATNAACGYVPSSVGPNYCSADQTIYLDETFFDQLYARFGGSKGDVAQAYVIAHEAGHHVQHELGTLESAQARMQASSASANDTSERLELQADCYAGIWAKDAEQKGIITGAEMEEAISAASAVGDDNIQKTEGGQVNPDSFTHGSSADRVKWLRTGYTQGTLEACNTF